MKALAATSLGFVMSLVLGLVTTACSSEDPCECAPRPERPIEQSVPLETAVRYTDGGNTAIRPLDFSEGTITTEGDILTVSYVNPEGEYTVTYEKQDGYDY